MTSSSLPSFDDWVEYCFARAYRDWWTRSDESSARVERFTVIEPRIIVQYITRLFRDPHFIADRFTDDQISGAVHFIFGISSGYFYAVRDDSVESHARVECVRSVEPMYLRLLDHVCCGRGRDPDARYEGGVDEAVFMIWDMDVIGEAAKGPPATAALADTCIEVLDNVLNRCRTSTCKGSALHGIGHLYGFHSDYGKAPSKPVAVRLRAIVDEFLGRSDVPEWLREYALQAREGRVM